MDSQCELVNVVTLSRILRVPASWLKVEAESNRIPYLKAGRRLLFSPKAVERVLIERATKGAGQ